MMCVSEFAVKFENAQKINIALIKNVCEDVIAST